MTDTFLKEFFSDIEVRLSEIYSLIDVARDKFEVDDKAYDAVCRSSCVMLVSHMEGLCKLLSRAIISDLNKFLDFAHMPNKIKREYCAQFIYAEKIDEKNINSAINKLLTLLDIANPKIDLDIFTSKNKNPSPNFLRLLANSFGTEDAFSYIKDSIVDGIFSTDSIEYIKDITLKLKDIANEGSNYYPYKFDLDKTLLDQKANKETKSETLSETFISQILTIRHNIAHGDSIENKKSLIEIQRDLEKTKCIMYAFSIVVTNKLSRKSSN